VTPEKTFDIVALLDESRAIFEAAMEAIVEDRAHVKPAPDAWSAIEIIEHVTLAERGMLGMLLESDLAEGGHRDHAKEAAIYSQISGRLSKVEAPERAHPKGRFTNLDTAKRQFSTARAQTIQFACDRADELTRLSAQHMRVGLVNGVEMLVIIAAHSCRHAKQLQQTA
jgi:hypothetical protein